MYKSLINDIDFFIENHIPTNLLEKEQHYFKEGLSVAKQLIEQAADVDSSELAYETLETVLKSISTHIFKDEVYQLVDEIYGAED